MSIFTKATACAFLIFLALCSTPDVAVCAKAESRIVTRIENASAVMKGRKLVIHADGMATTGGSLLPKGGELVRRGQNFQPNKDGLLEYELHFIPSGKPTEKLHPVKAELTERSFPANFKGVRVFAEFNKMDAMLAEPKKKKK